MDYLTDDLGLSPEFLADEDVARDEENYGRSARCGGPEYIDGQNVGCQGCRHCCPPEHDSKPYGFGIERFEDPALLAANEEMQQRWFGGPYRRLSWQELIRYGMWHQERDRIWKQNSRWSDGLYRRSVKVWNYICDSSETHKEAVERYTQWATKAVAEQKRKAA